MNLLNYGHTGRHCATTEPLKFGMQQQRVALLSKKVTELLRACECDVRVPEDDHDLVLTV